MTTFTRTWNASYAAIPADEEDIALGATRIRHLKADIKERMQVDHSWAGDTEDGAHNKISMRTLAADPVAVANYGFLYVKDMGAGTIELFFRDAAGNIIPLTHAGRTQPMINVFDYMTAQQIEDVINRTAGIDVLAAINNAIAAAAAAGGGVIWFPSGIYGVSAPIILRSKVYLLGEGSRNTEIKLLAGANSSILEIDNFATLTLSNIERISDGCPYSFGFDCMSFNGNKAAQASGNYGIALFGKRYHVGFDVMVYDTKGIAFYSECGDAGGQFEVDDMPEGYIGQLRIYMPDKEGFVFYGPHDAQIHKVSVSQAGQAGTYDGAIFSRKEGVYNGICYILGHIHCYACTGAGIRLRTKVLANMLTGESCWQQGVVIETNSVDWTGSYYSTINVLEAYHNDQADTGLYWNIDIHGQHNMVGKMIVTNNQQSMGGVHIDGNGNMITNGNILGTNATSNGTGLFVEASYGEYHCKILNFNNAGDVGFNSGTNAHNKFFITTYECASFWEHTGVSAYNSYHVNGYAATGTLFTQSGSFSETDTFDVKLQLGTPAFGFSQYGGLTSAITSGNTSQTITHLGFIAPKASDIHITLTGDWGGRDWWIDNITATTFDIVTDVVAPGAGLPFSWRMHMN